MSAGARDKEDTKSITTPISPAKVSHANGYRITHLLPALWHHLHFRFQVKPLAWVMENQSYTQDPIAKLGMFLNTPLTWPQRGILLVLQQSRKKTNRWAFDKCNTLYNIVSNFITSLNINHLYCVFFFVLKTRTKSHFGSAVFDLRETACSHCSHTQSTQSTIST